jgi:hypothetical protein
MSLGVDLNRYVSVEVAADTTSMRARATSSPSSSW